jgi:hypothetical protein
VDYISSDGAAWKNPFNIFAKVKRPLILKLLVKKTTTEQFELNALNAE